MVALRELSFVPDVAESVSGAALPKRALRHFQSGNAFYDAGDYEQALHEYDAVLAVRTDIPEALNNRGIAHCAGRPRRGATDYDEALRMDRDFPDALVNRGIVRNLAGDLAGALADFSEALQVGPKIRVNRGVTRRQTGDLAGALPTMTSAAIAPGFLEALVNAGVIRSQMGDLSRGAGRLRTALQLSPDSPEALTNRGVVRMETGDVDGALADFDAALRPDSSDALTNRGAIRSRRGGPRRGASRLRRSARD